MAIVRQRSCQLALRAQRVYRGIHCLRDQRLQPKRVEMGCEYSLLRNGYRQTVDTVRFL